MESTGLVKALPQATASHPTPSVSGAPQQANLLIQEGLVLGYVHHSVELFHRECRVIRCYQCQGLGHTAKFCRHRARCGWCSSQEHSNDKECPGRAAKQSAQCANCKGSHPVWVSHYPVRQTAANQAREAFLNRPTRFAESPHYPLLSRLMAEPRGAPKRKTQPNQGEDGPRPRGRPRAMDTAGREQQGAIIRWVGQPQPQLSEDDSAMDTEA